MKPVVFTISAVPGAGKTSLTSRLRSRFPAAPSLAHDDFATATSWPLEKIVAWFERGGDCNEFDCTPLVKELRRALGDRPEPTPLFLETHFGRRHRAIEPFVDKLIWIDVPLDIALARQMRAFTLDALKRPSGSPGYLDWQKSYLEHYQRYLQRMYRRQREDILPSADLVVDGQAAPDHIADEVAAFVVSTLRG